MSIDKPTTDREMYISQVAGILAEDTTGLPFEELAARGNRLGWGFDCRLPSQRPYFGGDWSHVADVVLSVRDLQTAIETAYRWERGDYER